MKKRECNDLKQSISDLFKTATLQVIWKIDMKRKAK